MIIGRVGLSILLDTESKNEWNDAKKFWQLKITIKIN